MSAWTAERPTKAGWWWYRKGEYMARCVVEVGPRQQIMDPYSGFWVWFTSGRQEKLENLDGEWQKVQGPVE